MIHQFQNEFRFLSSFYPVPHGVLLDGVLYPSVEHAYQAAKLRPEKRLKHIDRSAAPGQVKRASRTNDFKVDVRDDWDEIKLEVMKDLVRQKFVPGSDLAEKLLATGDQPIVEGNNWGDSFWGVSLKTGEGQNHLGKILMERRSDLRSIMEANNTDKTNSE